MNLPPPDLIETMAAAFYESSRSNAMSLPPWDKCLEHWRVACRRDMAKALQAAAGAGYRIETP